MNGATRSARSFDPGTAGPGLWQLLRAPSRWLLLALVANAVVLLLLTVLGVPGGIPDTAMICNAIGLGIWAVFVILHVILGRRASALTIALFAVPTGFVLGAKVAAWGGATDLLALAAHSPRHEWQVIAGGLLVAMLATGFMLLALRSQTMRADLQAERRRAAEALQSETSARLALLQAQIEPHFLFNTLANVRSVIDSDPRVAKAILEHLNRYLRVSLGRTRRASYTLAEEIELVESLLEISALRLGHRLRYAIEVPKELGPLSMPPLLLQPLVENALEHGVGPAVSGGEICIHAQRRGDELALRVSDTGAGLGTTSPEGVGLANVRGRLASLYGGRGRLSLFANSPRGVIAELVIPIEEVDRADRNHRG